MRIKGGLNAKKKHNRVLKLAKGYRGSRSKHYRVAKQSVMRALTESYRGRKERKRQFRQLWIARINAAARLNGLSYSKFMFGLKNAGIEMNLNLLYEIAIACAVGCASRDGLCGRTRISMTIRSSWALADFRFPMKNQISNSEKHIKKEPILMNRFFDAEEGI